MNQKKESEKRKVFINFVVRPDGKISDIKLLKGAKDHPEYDAEAMRIVQLMPNWIPGKQKGKNVPVSFNLPMTF